MSGKRSVAFFPLERGFLDFGEIFVHWGDQAGVGSHSGVCSRGGKGTQPSNSTRKKGRSERGACGGEVSQDHATTAWGPQMPLPKMALRMGSRFSGEETSPPALSILQSQQAA